MKKFSFFAVLMFSILFGNSIYAKEKVHIITMQSGGTDAIILESNGKFAMIDTGEDDSSPDGSSFRYPKREGISEKKYSIEDRLFSYIEKLGIKKFEFIIITHTHSDHIGNAPKILDKIPTEKVYLKKYSDERISDKDRLWDNQYGYDRTVESAQRNNVELIQDISRNHANFNFENMNLQLYNYENEYDNKGELKKVYDDNLNSIMAVVSFGNSRLFFGGDMENTDGREDLYGPIIGKVDFMKFNHHFEVTRSNSKNFIANLAPKVMLKTNATKLDKNFTEFMKNSNIALKNAGRSDVEALVFEIDRERGIVDTTENYVKNGFYRENGVLKFKDWQGKALDGVFYHLDNRYKFNSDGTITIGWIDYLYYADEDGKFVENAWRKIEDEWYYFDEYGIRSTNWYRVGNSWYYSDSEGRMLANAWKDNYYLGSDGAMLVDTVTPDGYHVDSKGKYYEFFEWSKENDNWKLKKDGVLLKNKWEDVSGIWYYFDNSENMVTGWNKIGGSWYYFSKDGSMASNKWQDGYYLGKNGDMLVNTTTPDGTKVDENGKQISLNSWIKSDGRWKFLDKYGNFPKSQFLEIENKKYYFDENEYMSTSWKKIEKDWFFFDKSSGEMLTKTWVGEYYIGEEGKMLINTTTPDGFKVDENGKKVN